MNVFGYSHFTSYGALKTQTEKELKEERAELKKKITLKQDRLKVLGKKK